MSESSTPETLPFTLDQIAGDIADHLGDNVYGPQGEQPDVSYDELAGDDQRVVWVSSPGADEQFVIVVARHVPEDPDEVYEVSLDVRPAP